MIRRLVGFLCLAAICGSLLHGGIAGAQEPGVEFAVEPGPRSQTAPGGGYFQIEAEPGQDVLQSILLRNESGRRLTLDLAAVDAVTGQLGGASYGVPQDPVERTGAWIELDRTKIRLDAGEAASVGFAVAVPADASPGQHLAGIAVSEVGEEEEGKEPDAVSVVVNTRRIIAVQVDLPGSEVPDLVVTGIEAAARPDGLYLEIGIENQGTAMTTGEGTVEIPAQGFIRDFAVDTFVPATSIGYPIKWTDDPREGVFEATVEIRYEGGVAQWAGSITVGDPLLEDLVDRGVDVPGGLPIVPIATVVVVIAAAIAGWWAVRRRRAGASLPLRGVIQAGASTRPTTSIPLGRAGGSLPAVEPRYPVSGPPPPPPPSEISPTP